MKKSFLLCATAVLLAACGGGGGGGGETPTTAPTPTVSPENKPTEPTPSGSDNNNATTENSQSQATETKPTEPKVTESTVAPDTPPAPIETKPNETKADNNKVEAPTLPPVEPKPEVIKEITKLENTGLYLDRSQFRKGKEIKEKPVVINGFNIATLAGFNRNYSFNGAIMMKNKDEIAEVVLDNVAVPLINKGVEYATEASNLANWQVYALKRMAETGWNALKSSEIVRDVFYDGLETSVSDMPTTGKATYVGNITRLDNNSAKVINIGKSELTADFESKTIHGKLTTDNRWLKLNFPRNISLEPTKIMGNSFNGTAIAEANLVAPISRTGKYEGKFYGPKAEEVAGKATFEGKAFWGGSLEDLNTSFSAERGAIR